MDGTIRVVDLERLVELRTLRPTGNTNPPLFSFSSDGHHWAACQMEETLGGSGISPQRVDLWRDENSGFRHSLLEHPLRIGRMQFDPSSTHLLTYCPRSSHSFLANQRRHIGPNYFPP
jgi:hypothetical protein